MHPYIVQKLAAARARDLRKRSAEMEHAKAARRGRAGTRPGTGVTRRSRRQRRPARSAGAARRLLRRVAAVVAECRYAQRRATALRASADMYMLGPAGAPENYREFLLRSSGPLIHEPTAAHRMAGQPVR